MCLPMKACEPQTKSVNCVLGWFIVVCVYFIEFWLRFHLNLLFLDKKKPLEGEIAVVQDKI